MGISGSLDYSVREHGLRNEANRTRTGATFMSGRTQTEVIGIGKQSAAEDAYCRLRDLIISGALRPGEVLSEQDIVDHLGIGRTPVREALKRLAAQHVVIIFPRRGVAVAKLGLADIQAIFEARETVEGTLAALAAQRRTEDEAIALCELAEEVKQAGGRRNFHAFLELDQQLHHAIAAAARSRHLAESADHLLMLSDWIWHQYFALHNSRPSEFFSHEEILLAIVERDTERATQAMRAHVKRSRDMVYGVV